MKVFRISRISLVGFVASLLLVACTGPQRPLVPSGPQAPPLAAPKRIVAAIKGEPAMLHDIAGGIGHVAGANELDQLVHVGLAVQDDQVQLRPVLAEAVPSVENGLWQVLPNGQMQTTWRLRPQAVWHDGVPFTSEDLLFTATVIRDREIPEFRNAAYDIIESVEAPDLYTVNVKWTRPYILADQLFTEPTSVPHPKHLLEQDYLSNKANYTSVPYWLEGFVGTGPFKVEEWVRGSYARLEAFDQYILGRPHLDEIEVRFMQDSNAVIASLLAGTIELTLTANGVLALDQALQIRDQWPSGKIDPVVGRAISVSPQLLNPSPPIIGEVRFRRALLHAMDRQALVTNLEGGLSAVAHTHFTMLQPEFNDVIDAAVRYDYDPARATQLIEDLGYVRGSDGMFRDAAGQALAVELRSTPGRDVNEKSTLIVANDWQHLGVGVNTVVVPLQRNQDAEYRSTRPGFEVAGTPDDPIRLHSAQVPVPENHFFGDNRSRYASTELDRVIEKYYVTIPRAERVQALRDFIHQVTDQVVVMSLFYEAAPLMVSNRLRNIHAAAPAWNGQEWDVIDG